MPKGASTSFMVASGVLSERYGHDGPCIGLGDDQTEAEGGPSQGGRGDALLRRMTPYLTYHGLGARVLKWVGKYTG